MACKYLLCSVLRWNLSAYRVSCIIFQRFHFPVSETRLQFATHRRRTSMNFSGTELIFQIFIKLMRIRRIELICSDWDLRNFSSEVLHFNCIYDYTFVYLAFRPFGWINMWKGTCKRPLLNVHYICTQELNLTCSCACQIACRWSSYYRYRTNTEWTDEGSPEPGWRSSWIPHCRIENNFQNRLVTISHMIALKVWKENVLSAWRTIQTQTMIFLSHICFYFTSMPSQRPE